MNCEKSENLCLHHDFKDIQVYCKQWDTLWNVSSCWLSKRTVRVISNDPPFKMAMANSLLKVLSD